MLSLGCEGKGGCLNLFPKTHPLALALHRGGKGSAGVLGEVTSAKWSQRRSTSGDLLVRLIQLFAWCCHSNRNSAPPGYSCASGRGHYHDAPYTHLFISSQTIIRQFSRWFQAAFQHHHNNWLLLYIPYTINNNWLLLYIPHTIPWM